MTSTATAPVPGTHEPDDREIVAAVLGGRHEAFECLVRRNNQLLFRIGMAYLRDHQQVEDAMQNAYLNAFLHLDRYHGEAAFSTWLTRIMINECLMFLRKQRTAQAAWENGLAESLRIDGAFHSADADATRNEIQALLEGAIASLPDRYRVVYIMREVQHMDTLETARCLDLSVDLVKVRLHRAREMLKEQLLASAAGVELFSYEAPRCNRLTARVLSAIRETKNRQKTKS